MEVSIWLRVTSPIQHEIPATVDPSCLTKVSKGVFNVRGPEMKQPCKMAFSWMRGCLKARRLVQT